MESEVLLTGILTRNTDCVPAAAETCLRQPSAAITACPRFGPVSRDTSAEANGPALLASLSSAPAASAVTRTPVMP